MTLHRSLSSPVRTSSTLHPQLPSPPSPSTNNTPPDTLPSSRALDVTSLRRNNDDDAALVPSLRRNNDDAALCHEYAPSLLSTTLPFRVPSPSSPLPDHAVPATATLHQLAHLARLSKYHGRKRNIARIRLTRTLVSTALGARLTRCADIAHRNLVDSFRRDDKEAFAALYHAIHDVRKSCDELRRFALVEPDLESQSSPILGSSNSLPSNTLRPTFLHQISTSARTCLLKFLSDIRNDPDYLPTRIAALSSSDLNVFLNPHRGLEPVESVLSSNGRPHARSHHHNHHNHHHHQHRLALADVDRFMSFQRHDPLSLLIHTCFANSAGPDSNEDQKRLDIWASVLARLISEPKSSSEHFLICVLNCWTMMREWSGKSNMEWYLMKILSDGAFLLERAEDQHGTRFNLSDWTQSDETAAHEFYQHAVDQLFDIVDDPDKTGIPDGLLELGNAVLNKLDSKYIDNTSKWLVWRCLFFVFFLGVIVHPESHGLLPEHYITPYAREKILKKVAMKAHEYVSGLWSGKKSASAKNEIPQHIKAHIESILSSFQDKSYKTPSSRLLPAKSITSLRETAKVHPYLVVCPADLSTLVNALYPERRPLSSASGTLRSGSASFSGLSATSQPVDFSDPRNSYETASIVSTSVSSVFSDTASRDEEAYGTAKSGSLRDSPTITEPDLQRKLNKYEDDACPLRLALHELSRTIGIDVVRGSSHPCAEPWAVLFISSDGKELATSLGLDSVNDYEDAHTSCSDYDSEAVTSGSDLDKDYHHLRDAVLKLVEEYDIPRDLEDEGGSLKMSNCPSKVKKSNSKRSSRREAPAPEPNGGVLLRPVQSPQLSLHSATASVHAEREAPLMTMLKAAWSQSRAQSDFASSHVYWKTLNQLRLLKPDSLRRNGYAALIDTFSREPKESITRSAAAIDEYEAWFVWLKQSQERLEVQIDCMMRRTRAIRDKMWYTADVRNSKEYEHSRDICQALRAMNGAKSRPQTWTRSGRSTSYIYKAESQVLDLIAASPDQGGPNKLADEQAEMTASWLKQYGIENFCQGEERIHRFCYEVERCVRKLIGETIREAPVLWSSELYKRDKAVYDGMKAREREHGWLSDDSSSIMSENERRQKSFSALRPSAFGRDLRSMSSQNTSQQSLDSVRHGFTRHTASLSEMLDGHDPLFDRYSPVNTTDAVPTFWSPFQHSQSGFLARAYSPALSATNNSGTYSNSSPLIPPLSSHESFSTARSAMSTSSSETVYQHSAHCDGVRFLSELRQSLTSLLLSDLGSQLLSRGSETDVWVARLGQECIDRKDALERHVQRKQTLKEKTNRTSAKPRVIEKKKSFGNLRGAGESVMERTDGLDAVSGPNASRNVAASEDGTSGKLKKPESEFPFKDAYRRLLTNFSVHPSPYAKLKALKELEHLLVASMLGSRQGQRGSKWKADASSGGEERESSTCRRSALDGAIDSVQEKRMQHASHHNVGKARHSYGADGVIMELMKLFRDASMRPKQLFRDLQLISCFVSPETLDRPDKSKGFWDVGLAALKLKSEICRTMVEMADEVFAAHTQNRGSAADTTVSSGGQTKASASSTPPPASWTYELKDVGQMWAITAKEGFPAAQRELALFYLSNPEFVERITLPLSKPSEVFKQVVMDNFKRNDKRTSGVSSQGIMGGGGGGSGSGEGGGRNGLDDGKGRGKDNDVRNDAGLMCVAVHWMEAAEEGGDELATTFLRQNEFMGR